MISSVLLFSLKLILKVGCFTFLEKKLKKYAWHGFWGKLLYFSAHYKCKFSLVIREG
jgi:hypothetical protein